MYLSAGQDWDDRIQPPSLRQQPQGQHYWKRKPETKQLIKKQTTNVNKHRKTITITPATTTTLLVVLITSWNVRLMMSVVVQLTELVKLPGADETKPVAREEERSSLVLMDMDTLAVLLRVLRSILHSNRIEPSHARLAVLGARARACGRCEPQLHETYASRCRETSGSVLDHPNQRRILQTYTTNCEQYH